MLARVWGSLADSPIPIPPPLLREMLAKMDEAWKSHIYPYTLDCNVPISITNIKIPVTYSSQIVGIIYPIEIYISKNVHSPTLCPKGTQKPSSLHSSPKCWHAISNINIQIQLTYITQNVGCTNQHNYFMVHTSEIICDTSCIFHIS